MAQGGRLVRTALQHALAAPVRLHRHQQQQRAFHASGVALARKSKRSGPVTPSTVKKTQAVFGEAEVDEDDEKEIEEWFNQMQQQGGKKTARQQQQEKFGALANDDDSDDDSDDEDVNDKETEEFLSEVDDLFTLEPEEFERKMETYDKRQANARRDFDDDEEDDDSLEDTDEADEIEIDRATERISKKKLLKVLDDLQPGGGGKNAESMTPPKTKNSAPLEKKPKKINVDRISYRQERVELSVVDFVQNLLLQDSDSNATDVVANIAEASVAPDLRRVVLFWEPQRLNSENQTISKRKVAGIERRLQSQERWIRAQVTRHLNLKYSPNVQFKQRKSAKSDEMRAAFDQEMDWLNRF
ncbi:hypothetical protein Gpo141_00007851 [Globisporangium polare]